jgi:hypothetical protein
MIPFAKPGANKPYPEMAAKATRAALADAGLGYELISRPTSATSTATPPAASARCTRWA